MRHGELSSDGAMEVLEGPDPTLALVVADPIAFQLAYPCRCAFEGEPCENCNPREDV